MYYPGREQERGKKRFLVCARFPNPGIPGTPEAKSLSCRYNPKDHGQNILLATPSLLGIPWWRGSCGTGGQLAFDGRYFEIGQGEGEIFRIPRGRT